MLRSVRLVQDERSDEADQRAERPLSQEEASRLAETMAELTYLDHLEAVRASNVASLKRLKDACDALLANGLGSSNATLPPDSPAKDQPVSQ